MASHLLKLLEISEKYLYLKPIRVGSVISHFDYGPLGETIRQNILNEWNYSNVTCRDMNVFPFSAYNSGSDLIKGLAEHFNQAKSMSDDKLPFSIVYSGIPVVQEELNSVEVEESKYFRPRNVRIMKCVTFTLPDDGLRFFHYWLRQRKMWWRKFSANPTKFSLADINVDETKNTEFANIEASFPWATECVETVRYFSTNIFHQVSDTDREMWTIGKDKKKLLPCVIESTTNLDLATFTLLCDAFVEDVRVDSDKPHQLMKLHRKLAPYKTAIVLDAKNSQDIEDLAHLAEYLALNLKKNGISTLLLAPNKKNSLDNWFQYYDLLSVPFVTVLQPSTLTDGVFSLRSRETTLQERLHISKLTEYIVKLLKNY